MLRGSRRKVVSRACIQDEQALIPLVEILQTRPSVVFWGVANVLD